MYERTRDDIRLATLAAKHATSGTRAIIVTLNATGNTSSSAGLTSTARLSSYTQSATSA